MLTINNNTFSFKYLLVLVIFSKLLISCNSAEIAPKQETPANENKKEIILTAKQFESSNMLLGKLEKHVFSQSIKSYGVIDVPPENK